MGLLLALLFAIAFWFSCPKLRVETPVPELEMN
jgi:hypothetical protein